VTGHRRFFIEQGAIVGDSAVITGDVARQIERVLRLKNGDSICLVDGRGTEFDAEITALSGGAVSARILGSRRCDADPLVRLMLAICLPKGDKINFIVQKCTELGVSELIVVSSERTVARIPDEKVSSRLARWRKIAKEAAEQCGRAAAPGVEGILRISDLAELASTVPVALLACESGDPPPLRRVLREGFRHDGSADETGACPLPERGSSDLGSVMIIVGPEGGLSETEIRLLVDAGAVPVSLGRRILRCETAAVAACAAVMYELEGEL